MRGYDTCLIICHGKSELIFIKNLRSNLRLKFETFAKNNGNASIQISGLIRCLNSRHLKSLSALKNKYNLNVKGKKILNFKVFIIMDFDEQDCTDLMKRNYLNKSMFNGHFLYDYIVPIFNDKNFDEVLKMAGFDIDTKNKTKSYSNIFPGKVGDFERFLEVKNKISGVDKKYTNVNLVLDYLLKSYNEKSKY